MTQKKDLKISLPRTSFPMKGNLPIREPQWVEFWNKNKIYQKIQDKNKERSRFILIDGPPYANGRIHLGTTLNKILKDILIKYKNMSGHFSPFIPIWDCHGLPIELKATKKIKSRDPKDIREACRKEALHWVDIQKDQFERLGVLADWENKILTMNSFYEAEEVFLLSQLVRKNLIYRGKRPIHWCIKLQTATSASEVEYQSHRSPSIFVKFETLDKKFPSNTFFVIWTTTPWTLPANQAICLKSDLVYGLYESSLGFLILAQDLKESFEKETGLSLHLKNSFKGKDLEYSSYIHPLTNQSLPIVLGDHVTLDAGTGCVHTAPGHGMEDFVVGSKYKLPLFCPVDERGNFTDEVPEFKGLNIFKANPLIIEKLKKSKHLIQEKEIEHSYPFNPRSKFPLIFRITDQWFLNFSDKKNPIRHTALKACDSQINFIPQWNQQRLKGMVKESPDWCLSRQRYWGVPLPVFYCQSCGSPLCESSIMEEISKKMKETQEGIEYYFSKSSEELLPQNIKCKKCSHTKFNKGKDILDVWFDSGICHTVIRKLKGESFFPAHVYLEGSDQHRGWFQTSLNSSVALHQVPPFKTLITHGFVYDLEKRKMSKSLGNIVDPQDIIKKYGAEILRLWVASCNFSQDISSGEEIIDRVRETYRRFRNTIRFMLGNLFDFDFEKNSIPLSEMTELDQWILSQLSELSKETLSYYSQFEFHKVYQKLNQFYTLDLSSLYLDMIKDRLYTFKADGKHRRSAQTALFILLKNILKIKAPFTTFLSEEAYSHLNLLNKKESILLEDFEDLSSFYNLELNQKMKTLLEVRQIAHKEIEAMRQSGQIGSSLEVHLTLTLPSDTYKVFENYKYKNELFIVSRVDIEKGSEVKVTGQKALGEKCQRCWCYEPKLNKEHFCQKCVSQL